MCAHLLKALDADPPVEGNNEEVFAWDVAMLLEQVPQKQCIKHLLLGALREVSKELSIVRPQLRAGVVTVPAHATGRIQDVFGKYRDALAAWCPSI